MEVRRGVLGCPPHRTARLHTPAQAPLVARGCHFRLTNQQAPAFVGGWQTGLGWAGLGLGIRVLRASVVVEIQAACITLVCFPHLRHAPSLSCVVGKTFLKASRLCLPSLDRLDSGSRLPTYPRPIDAGLCMW